MSARYTLAFERIRALLESRSQAEPLLEAEEIREQLGGWPTVRTIQRYVEQIRGEQIVVQRQTLRPTIGTVSPMVSTAGHPGERV
jgi:hypothetical protein